MELKFLVVSVTLTVFTWESSLTGKDMGKEVFIGIMEKYLRANGD
jgi:hypothetical protein